jgi:hypothetical protein
MKAEENQTPAPKKRRRREPRAWFISCGAKIPLGDVDLSLLPEDRDELREMMQWAKEHPGAKIPADMWAEKNMPPVVKPPRDPNRLSKFAQWRRDNPDFFVEILDMRAVLK